MFTNKRYRAGYDRERGIREKKMHNDIFTIGKFTIHGYGLMIAIGVIVAVLVAIYRAKKAGIDPEVVLDLVLIGLICGFGGGKILYLIVEWKDFINLPKLAFSKERQQIIVAENDDNNKEKDGVQR